MEQFTVEIKGTEYIVFPILDNGSMIYRVEIEGAYVLYKANEFGNLAAGVLPEGVDLALIEEIGNKIEAYWA